MKRWLASLAFAATAFAQEKKEEPPSVLALSPLHLTAGEKGTLHLRGQKLKDATEVRVTPDAAATLKEKKDATVPNGLEAKDVGNTEVAIELTPPADCTKLAVLIVTPTGMPEVREVPVFPRDAFTAEKEPNNGFREAQTWDTAKPRTGKIDGDKDVDVFRITGVAGKPLNVRIVAASVGSLLDPILAIFDAEGRLLASADDTDGTRDARLSIVPKTDGAFLLVVSDAHDRGGSWHEYRLEVSP